MSEKQFYIEPNRFPIGFEIPDKAEDNKNKAEDNKTAYTGKDYPIHSAGPWVVTAGTVPDREGRLIVEDCSGNSVCATSSRGVQGRRPIMEANARLIAAAPEMLEALRWLDNEMGCRDYNYGYAQFTKADFEKVRSVINKAMNG